MVEREQLVKMVCAAQNGDNGAFTEIYDTFYNDIYYYIMKTVNEKELAMDLTQDTFIEIFRTIGALKEPVAFVNWSKKVAYHRCTAYFKKRVTENLSLIGRVEQTVTTMKATTGTGAKAYGKIMSLLTKKVIASIAAVVIAGGVLTTVVVVGNKEKGQGAKYSVVYGTTCGDTLVISTKPIKEYNGVKADEESLEFPLSAKKKRSVSFITKAVIIDEITTDSTESWFSQLSNLESVEGLKNLNTKYVTNMEHMFSDCDKLTNVGDLSNWDVSKITDMQRMFYNCETLDKLPARYD